MNSHPQGWALAGSTRRKAACQGAERAFAWHCLPRGKGHFLHCPALAIEPNRHRTPQHSSPCISGPDLCCFNHLGCSICQDLGGTQQFP